ncbi:hypothetical protein SAMN05660686_03203 [Thalassobaculum litoreum DSM 18839]|uniref:Uncharacterized protein n=1 Tax=Thalassobaculum litoreum DSM 18839 TaxID=1123362 RepID=A0A8G2BJG8_9PROT|nr:hypothetical protein SAMN05660686_03203 [Thalassobaculum litoreum DSM 18839]
MKPAESDWNKFARAQPSVSDRDRAPGMAARAESFIIEREGENLILKIKREDGRVALIELTPDTAFYLREYLSNALACLGMPEDV